MAARVTPDVVTAAAPHQNDRHTPKLYAFFRNLAVRFDGVKDGMRYGGYKIS
jgi:hypothetical protein